MLNPSKRLDIFALESTRNELMKSFQSEIDNSDSNLEKNTTDSRLSITSKIYNSENLTESRNSTKGISCINDLISLFIINY